MQREMPIFQDVKAETKPAPMELVKTCKNRLDAIRLCIQLSSQANETIAEQLGIDKGNFTRMMQGRAHFPDAKANQLIQICGNYAPLQYEAWSNGFKLVEAASSERIAELEKELAEARATA